MERLTEKRDNQNVIPLRKNGETKWAICSAGMGDAPTEYLYGDHADRLAAIEDILGPDYDLDRLRALMEADRDGLVRIAKRPILERECCGNCAHFQRITGTARGDCAVREYIRDHWGQEDRKRGKFTPSQSRKACRQFQRRTEEHGRSDSEV